MMNTGIRGMTLIELMIVILIVAILGAIAVPSYMSYMARGARASAAAALMEDAQAMERRYTEHSPSCYQCVGEAIGAIALPKTQAPDIGNASYTVALVDASTDISTFLLVATRTGSMAGDECGDLTINHLGVKGVINQPGGATITATECWNG